MTEEKVPEEDLLDKAFSTASRLFDSARAKSEEAIEIVLKEAHALFDISDEPPVTGRCSCGHPQAAHTRWMGPGAMDSKSGCSATTYETIEGGMHSWPCTCHRYQEKVG